MRQRPNAPQLYPRLRESKIVPQPRSSVAKIAQALASAALLVSFLSAQQSKDLKSANSTKGQQIFASACAGCHGLDGRGGERAPNIAEAPAVQRLSDDALIHIVSEGVPGAGMPPFNSLGASGISEVVKYLRVLEGRGQPSVLPGDRTQGRALFFGRAQCSSCHMIAGEGGFLASDLSGYGKGHSVEEIREAILNAGRDSNPHVKHATVTTNDGKQYDGLVRNEDNFSIQLQAMDGSYHFFEKTNVRNVEYQPGPIMPSNYASTLRPGELNDIISYLITAAQDSNMAEGSEKEE